MKKITLLSTPLLCSFLLSSDVLADEITVMRNIEGKKRERVYNGSSLKTSTYRLALEANSQEDCDNAVALKSQELKKEGFKIIDFDNTQCTDDTPGNPSIVILFE